MRARTVLLCSVLALASCGDNSAGRRACPANELCLEYGNQGEPGSLDPHHVTASAEGRIVGDLLSGLLEADADGKPVPGIAESWSTSADGLVWTFKLRASLWSDGTALTADDFVFALRRALEPATGMELASLLYVLKNASDVNSGRVGPAALGVRAVAGDILELELSHPTPYLPELATTPLMAPLPRHVVERWGDAWVMPQHFVGNGPFVLRAWRQGDRVSVSRNPRYWAAADVCFDEISYVPTTDSISAERRVMSGELDLNTDFQSNRAAWLRSRIPAYVHSNPYLSMTYLIFNSRLPKLRDVRVRRALSMAIDREFIARHVLLAGQMPAFNVVPPGTANSLGTGLPYWGSWSLQRRQQEARRLLADAGYGPGRPLSIQIKYRNQPDTALFLPAVQADWRSLGVETDLIQNETQIAYAAYQLADFEVGEAGFTADFNDPMTFLEEYRSQASGRNYGGYHSIAFDRLIDAAVAEVAAPARSKLLADAERTVLNDGAVAPVYFSVSRALVNPAITGWHSNPMARHPARYLCRGERGVQ